MVDDLLNSLSSKFSSVSSEIFAKSESAFRRLAKIWSLTWPRPKWMTCHDGWTV